MNNRPRTKRKPAQRRRATRHVTNQRAEPTRAQERRADRLLMQWIQLADYLPALPRFRLSGGQLDNR